MYRQVLISIVIPMYNAEEYIGQMITSIIKQTYENWELIIIDDGSSDSSYEVCKLFDDQRITIVSQENQGQMVARINGIAQAHGEYTLVVDADDYLETNCLEKIADAVKENHPDMVFFEYYSFFDGKKNRQECHFSDLPEIYSQDTIVNYIIKHWNHQLWNKAIKTKLLKRGSKEAIKEKVKINGDYALVMPVMCYVNSIKVLDDMLYNYRVASSSISHTYSFQQIADTDYISSNIVELMKKHGLLTKEIMDNIYIANLHMILLIANQLVTSNAMSRSMLAELKKMNIYRESAKYERIEYIGTRNWILSKVYRNNMYLLLPVVKKIIKNYS